MEKSCSYQTSVGEAGWRGWGVLPLSLASRSAMRSCRARRLIPTRSGRRVWSRSAGALAARGAVDDLAGDADDDRVGRHRLDHDGVGADPAAGADGDGPEDLGAGADGDAVADRWGGACRGQAGAAEGDAVVDGHVGADLGGLPDDHAGGVVDEQPGPEHRGGVDVHPGEPLDERRAQPGSQGPAVTPQPVGWRGGPTGRAGRDSTVRLRRCCGRPGHGPGPPADPRAGCARTASRPRAANRGVLR